MTEDSEDVPAVVIDSFGLEPMPHPPTPESAFAVVDGMLEGHPQTWKLYQSGPDYSTQVYYRTIASEPWYLRKTVHDGNVHPFEWFKRAIHDDHFENMVKYYSVVQSCELKEEREGGWQGFTLKYALPSPFADRDIATWLLKRQSDDAFTVVALPADIPLPEDATTRGVYSFFHHVRRTEDNKIEWIMAQTSDMKGNLPRWVQNYSISGILVKDVLDFTRWIEENYGETPDQAEADSEDEFKDAE